MMTRKGGGRGDQGVYFITGHTYIIIRYIIYKINIYLMCKTEVCKSSFLERSQKVLMQFYIQDRNYV